MTCRYEDDLQYGAKNLFIVCRSRGLLVVERKVDGAGRWGQATPLLVDRPLDPTASTPTLYIASWWRLIGIKVGSLSLLVQGVVVGPPILVMIHLNHRIQLTTNQSMRLLLGVLVDGVTDCSHGWGGARSNDLGGVDRPTRWAYHSCFVPRVFDIPFLMFFHVCHYTS
jgi:hypothetical protein